MNYEEIVVELDKVIKGSEQSAVKIIDSLQETLSLIEDENAFNSLFETINMIQQEDIFRQKLERVLNSICEAQGIDVSRFNIAPTAKHISGDNYEDEMSQSDIDALFKNNK